MKLGQRMVFSVLVLAVAGLGVGDRIVSRLERSPSSENDVARLAILVRLQPSMHIAEIGAGDGGMAVGVARRLSTSGLIYATELNNRQVANIRRAASAAGQDNLVAIQATEHSSGLPQHCCDVIYMRRVYHHLEDLPAMLRSLKEALRPGGRLVIIDFKSPGWRFYRPHGIAKEAVIAGINAAGLHLEREDEGWSWLDYCLVFRKPHVSETGLPARERSYLPIPVLFVREPMDRGSIRSIAYLPAPPV